MRRVAVVVALVGLACNGSLRFDEPPQNDAGAGAEAGVDASAASTCATDEACHGLRCDLGSGTCVACVADADCSGTLRRCEPTLHVCVACLTGGDCGKRHGCETTTHRCVDVCLDEDDCTAPGFACDFDRSLCIECKMSSSCAYSPNGTRCNTELGRCVECVSDPDCPAEKPICDPRTGRCAGCVSTRTCGPGQACNPVTLTCRAVTG